MKMTMSFSCTDTFIIWSFPVSQGMWRYFSSRLGEYKVAWHVTAYEVPCSGIGGVFNLAVWHFSENPSNLLPTNVMYQRNWYGIEHKA